MPLEGPALESNPRIFVSYARSDGVERGRALSLRLTADHGLRVWRDLQDLEGGGDWWRQITEALDHVEYLVLIITPAALDSKVIRDEWRYARHQGVCVIPVIGAPMLDLSALPTWMRRTHLVDPDQREQWTRFIRTLESPCRTPRVPMMAEPPPDDFVPRAHEFQALRTLLTGEARGGSLAITAALKGAGGYGKTTLARVLCHDELILETYYDGILWVTLGEEPGDPSARLEDLIVTLTGVPSRLISPESRKQRLMELLADRSVLLVIDDVWNAAHVQPFLVGGDSCARLITTRDSRTLPVKTLEVAVDAMQSAEAISLLEAGVPEVDRQVLAPLAARLGEWPLLLKLVNGMLRDRVARAGDTARGAVAHVTRLLEKRGYRAFDAHDPIQRHDAVSATLAASVLRLSRDEQRRLRELVIFPEDVDIPLDAIALLWSRTGALDEAETEACIQSLFSRSLLLDFNLAVRRVRIHDVIRGYLADEMPQDELRQLHSDLVESYRVRCGGRWSDAVEDVYFYRFLLYHLSAAGRSTEVRALLLDPSWIERKLRRTDVAEVLWDYEKYSSDHVTHLVADAVRLSAHVLAEEPDEVVPQLLGRIHADRFVEFAPLLEIWRSRTRGEEWLCPSTASLLAPGGALVQTIRSGPCIRRPSQSLSAIALARENVAVMERQVAMLVGDAAVTADGRFVAHGSGGFVELLDTTVHRDVLTVQCPDDYPVLAVAVTPDGCYLAALAGYWMEGSSPSTPTRGDAVHVWHVESKREVFSVARGGIQTFLIAGDGRRIVLQFNDGVVEVWSVTNAQRVSRWECGEIAAITFGLSNDEVVVASPEGTVTAWTVGTHEPRVTIAGAGEKALATAVTPDARSVARAFLDRRLEYHYVKHGEQIQKTLRPALDLYHSEPIRELSFTIDGRRIISSEFGAVRVWNADLDSTADLAGHRCDILSMTPDGQRLVAQSQDGSIVVRGVSDQDITLEGLCSPCDPPKITPDGRWVLNVERNGICGIWDTSTGKHVVSLAYGPRCFEITCDSRIIRVARTRAKSLALWMQRLTPDGAAPARRLRFGKIEPGRVVALAPFPNRTRLITVTCDGVFDWDLEDSTPRLVAMLPIDGELRNIRNACTDGRRLFLSGWERAELWDVQDGRKVLQFDKTISAMAFSPSGHRLIVAHDQTATLLNAGNGSKEGRFHADAPVRAVACPSDTSFIVASVDGRIHRLDLRN